MSSLQRGAVMVIRAGDPEIAEAIARGIAQARGGANGATASDPPAGLPLPEGPLEPEQIELVEAEIDRQHVQRALLRVSVGNTKTPEDYEILITKARGDYAKLYRRPGRLRRALDALLGVYGLLICLVSGAYAAQARVLERGEA